MACGGGGLTSYYRVLGVDTDACDEEIRRAYRRLAMQWHPDKWIRTPSLLGEAKQRFQQIQEAYSVLSDRRKRTLYDAGLYELYNDDEEDEVEGFSDFLQEMVTLMNDAKREENNCSIEDLQRMFWDMARGFDLPQWNQPIQQPAFEPQWFYGWNWYCSSTASNN
ncbi:uncharacterized protein LOC127260858 [Andrographis paniculata]|uniref:uncharacterized protein LOC127260858 n=1 Tax=Andrographis paniculata TaxID=175694 RepID=UPI0021E8804A|nr:uncharacterized protein LOC127260858 [Andrographis paniculata]